MDISGTKTRLLSTIAAAFLLVGLSISPASADVYVSGGSFACPPDSKIRMQAHGGGTIRYYVNGSERYLLYGPAVSYWKFDYNGRSLRSWKISSDEVLYNSGTGLSCLY